MPAVSRVPASCIDARFVLRLWHGTKLRFFFRYVGYHPTIFTENPIFLTFLSHKICIYQKKCVPLHSISKVFFFPFGATACGCTFQCPTTDRSASHRLAFLFLPFQGNLITRFPVVIPLYRDSVIPLHHTTLVLCSAMTRRVEWCSVHGTYNAEKDFSYYSD